MERKNAMRMKLLCFLILSLPPLLPHVVARCGETPGGYAEGRLWSHSPVFQIFPLNSHPNHSCQCLSWYRQRHRSFHSESCGDVGDDQLRRASGDQACASRRARYAPPWLIMGGRQWLNNLPSRMSCGGSIPGRPQVTRHHFPWPHVPMPTAHACRRTAPTPTSIAAPPPPALARQGLPPSSQPSPASPLGSKADHTP